jgi:hypothetical protein
MIITNLSKGQDLPNPTANIQTLPSGSLVIAMDNTNQANPGYFNLKSYGLVVSLLNVTKHVQWVIKSGKLHDDADFSVSAEKLYPSFSSATLKDFKSGPFIIFVNDTSGVGALINSFNATQSTGNKVNVYRTIQPVNVDVRYDLYGYKPKAAVLNDGGKASIHIKYMTNASIPATNYVTLTSATNLGQNCYTFASEPHNGGPSQSLIDSIRKFISINGGNFLAECESIISYENATNGKFQTTGGYNNPNTTLTNKVSYDNADLSYSQFEGIFNPNDGGSTQTYIRLSGSNPANNFYPIIRGNTTALSLTYGASVSKLISGKGGLVFYLGNHDLNGTTEELLNGQRMYLNAFLTPALAGCPDVVVPVKIEYFITQKITNSSVKLTWKTSNEINVEKFLVQKSVNNGSFVNINQIQSNKSGLYEFVDENLSNGYNMYRIASVDYSGKITYSNISVISKMGTKYTELSYGQSNYFVNIKCYGLTKRKTIVIYSMVGGIVKQLYQVADDFEIDLRELNNGMYILCIIDETGFMNKNKIIK